MSKQLPAGVEMKRCKGFSGGPRIESDTRGFQEIVVRGDDGAVKHVITHPCVGAGWFLHSFGSLSGRGKKFATKKAALAAAGK
jgi:hypothetical protein